MNVPAKIDVTRVNPLGLIRVVEFYGLNYCRRFRKNGISVQVSLSYTRKIPFSIIITRMLWVYFDDLIMDLYLKSCFQV